MEETSEVAKSQASIKMETLEEKELLVIKQIKLEDIEPPATPDSSKGETSNDSTKTESPKVVKPVLGKLQAKKRLMAFANKFNTMPKVNKLKAKPDKAKRQEKILAIEEIVREENQSRLAAQEARDINIRNVMHQRRAREASRERRNEERYSRRSSHRRSERDRRNRSRDRRSRSRSKQRSSRKSSREDERYSSSRHKEKKEKKDRKEKDDDRKDDSKTKQEESKSSKEESKSSEKVEKGEIKKDDGKDKKNDDSKQETKKSDSHKIDSDKLESENKKLDSKLEESIKQNILKFEISKEISNDKKNKSKHSDKKKEISEESGNVEVEKCNETKKDKKHKHDKVDKDNQAEVNKIEQVKSDKNNKLEQKSELSKQDIVTSESEKKEDSKFEKSKKDSKIETNKKEEKADKSKREDTKIEVHKREESKNDTKRDDDRDEVKVKRDEIKHSSSREVKLDRPEVKEASRDEPRMKVHREREREKDKLREIREKELLKCHSWKDFRRYGFGIDEMGYVRRSNNGDKSGEPRSAEEYSKHLEQMLMLSNSRFPRIAFIAEGLKGSKEYPPEIIKSTQAEPTILYCENPAYPLYFNRDHVLNAVSPDRREKMEDICGATQIMIITSEREEGHHERFWYKTMDPSKTISVRTSIDVPSFPRSKWDSENETSDNDNVFETSPTHDFVLTKEQDRVELPAEHQIEREKLEPLLEMKPETLKEKPEKHAEPESKPEPESVTKSPTKSETKESRKNSVESQAEEQPVKSKSKHKHKMKHSRSPSPRKKEKSPSHKKHKEEKTKHEKHRSRESKHHHHHHKHHHKNKKHADEPKALSVEKETTETKSVTPEHRQQEVGDEKLVSEYEQFIKMVSSTETETKTTENSTVIESPGPMVTAALPTSSPSTFYEFSLEAKLSKESPVAKSTEIIVPVGKSNKEVNKSDTNIKPHKVVANEKSAEKIEESKKVVKALTPSPQPEVLTGETGSEESNNEPSDQEVEKEREVEPAEEEEEEDDEDAESNSVPSDWENVKIKVEKLTDTEDSDITEASPAKVKASKKKRKRLESWSSETSSSTSSDSEDAKSKKRKRRRKRARKESTSESDSSDSSSSDTSSSEELRKKKKRKASKKKKKKRKRTKKLSKKLRRKRKKRDSTDSSSSDSDDKPPPKKRPRVVKNKRKKKNKAAKQNAEVVSEKTKSKPSESKKVVKVKEEKKSSTNKELAIESEEKQIQSPVIEKRNKRVSESTNSDWEKESIPRQTAKEPEEAAKVREDPKSSDVKETEKNDDDKKETKKSSKGQEKEMEATKMVSEDKKVEEPEMKKSKKDKKKEGNEFEKDWDRDEKAPIQVDKDKEIFAPLENKKPVIEWNETDFNSLDVFSIHQLPPHHLVDKCMTEIYANEWEVDSQEALPKPVSPPVIPETKFKKVEKVVYDEKTDTYIPVGIESSKEKKRKDKRANTLRIWEDEQENADREEMIMTLEKKLSTEPKPIVKLSKEPKDIEVNEKLADIINDDKPRRKNRWDVEGHAEGFENAPPVNWEEEADIWPTKFTPVNKSSDVSLASPLLDDIIKDDNVANDIVDSPDTLRKKMEKIAMLERALIDKVVETSPPEVLNNLNELKTTMEVKDTLDLEPPNPNEIAAMKDQKLLVVKEKFTKDSSSKRNKTDKSSVGSWESTGSAIDDEFCIPVLAEIDSKLEASGSSRGDKFLDCENLLFESNLLNKAEAKSSEVLGEKSKVVIKLIPKQVISQTKKFDDFEEEPKLVQTNKSADVPASHRSSPSGDKKRSPSRKDVGKSSSKNNDGKDKGRKRSPPNSWDSRELTKNRRSSRSRSRSKSRSRSRSPRRRDDRKGHKRDKRSPYRDSKRKNDRSKRSPDKNRDKSYDPMEILRERNYDGDRGRDKSRGDDDTSKSRRCADHPDDYNYENKRSRDDSLDRDSKGPRSNARSRIRRDRRSTRSRSPISPGRKSRKSPPRWRSPPPRSKYRSRSRSWTRSRSSSRSRTRSRTRSRSRSGSRSRFRSLDKSRRSRSYSPGRNRFAETDRFKYDDEKTRLEEEIHRLRDGVNRPSSMLTRPIDPSTGALVTPIRPRSRLDTIIQLTGDEPQENQIPVPNPQLYNRYPNEGEQEPEFNTYCQARNLTYPKIADETSTDSPKRLSLDERLELELGIKKDSPVPAPYGSPVFIPGVPGFPKGPPPPIHRHFPPRHPPPTVLQVGNVLQVVPSEFPVRPPEPPPQIAPVVPPANQIVRVGDVLQVVPTTVIDWAPGVRQSPVAVVATPIRFPPPPLVTPSSSPAIASPLQPIAIGQLPAIVKPMLSIITSPQVASSPAVAFPTPKPLPPPPPPPPEPVVQPVYNYEAIMEARRIEREERKRLKELKRKEKERRRLERAKRRTERILNKSKAIPTTSATINTVYNKPSVNAELNAIITSEMNKSMETEESQSSMTGEEIEEAVGTPVNAVFNNDEGDNEEEEDEQEEEQEQQQPEENEEESEEVTPAEENGSATAVVKQEDVKITIIPPPPAKGILILPGFINLSKTNGILNDMDELTSEKDEANPVDEGLGKDDDSRSASTSLKVFERARKKKAVLFADGIKPGEGTSPSGGEGDIASPPPPTATNLPQDLTLDISKKLRAKKLRKKQKHSKPVKTKKKIKVKIIKLKKPKISPISSLLEDSDEMDDRSPPPPPPGSPPPPHLWPSYLQTYQPNGPTTTSSTVRPAPAVTPTPTLPPAEAPPTPLPLLVPPPPLNYSIQPSRA